MWGNDFTSSFLAFLKIYITKKRKFHQFQNNYYKVWPKFIKKCDRYDKVKQSLLQSVTGMQTVTLGYYKVRQVLQSVTVRGCFKFFQTRNWF